MRTIDLTGQTALVVGGGGGGIGTAMVEALAGAGADIGAITIDPEHAADTRTRIEAMGRRCVALVADVTDDAAFQLAVDEVLRELGTTQLLVNVVGGAGVDDWGRAKDYELEQFDRVMSRNVRYAMVSAQTVARSLVDAGQSGAIVNVSTVATRAVPLLVAYGAAKAALEAMTRTMAAEWGQYGIRVNAVAAGTIRTPRAGTSDMEDAASKSIPLGRRGTPADIANASLFMLSDLAAYITGQTLTVDGGGNLGAAGDSLPVFVTNPKIRARFPD